MTCKYCKDEFCTNVDSSAYRNYCPCRDYDYVELCKFAVDGSNYSFKDICPKNMEVIGNIHDNPELLKEV